MSLNWVRLDTQFATNPKILYLVEDKAWRAINTYIFGLGYSGQHGTDGFIPRAALPFLHATKREADKLIDVGLWIPSPSGWDINGWAEFQPSTQEMKDRRIRARAGGEKRAANLTPEQRSESARHAAEQRWGKASDA